MVPAPWPREPTPGIRASNPPQRTFAVEFAREGFRSTGFEVSQDKVDRVRAGDSYIGDVPSEQLKALVDAGSIDATTDWERIADMDIVSICVPTPLSKTRDPDMSYVQKATDAIAKHLRKGQLIILESTTYPGTTEEVVRPALEAGGLRAEKDFFLAFSPERVDPSNTTYGIKNTPKIVGGVGPMSGELSRLFYATAIDQVVKVSQAAYSVLRNRTRSGG